MKHLIKHSSLVVLITLFTCSYASENNQKQYKYTYKDRKHTTKETSARVGILYVLGWASYVTQPKAFNDHGSFENYKNNLGKLVFDKDDPYWNWYVHPLSGSQLFLFFRANGYSRLDAFKLTILQSALYEFTTETYTEPASIQDLFQTPIIGSFLGVGLENLSLYFLNSGNKFYKVLGHIINPSTLFWFYEGKVEITPIVKEKKVAGLGLYIDF